MINTYFLFPTWECTCPPWLRWDTTLLGLVLLHHSLEWLVSVLGEASNGRPMTVEVIDCQAPMDFLPAADVAEGWSTCTVCTLLSVSLSQTQTQTTKGEKPLLAYVKGYAALNRSARRLLHEALFVLCALLEILQTWNKNGACVAVPPWAPPVANHKVLCLSEPSFS